MQKEPITDFGYKRVTEELKFLKETDRPKTVIDLDIARSHGDLKENAEYHAAKEKLAFIDAKLAELAELINNLQIVDPSSYSHDKVKFGSTVMLEDVDAGEEVTYTIVGAYESSPEHGLISYNSPLARQLLGKEEGDEIEVQLPGGSQTYEILEVGYKKIDFKE
jgi:transcription elongation factor GreA